jgi:RNA polymerase sigma-70 factor (ECF subfamily)
VPSSGGGAPREVKEDAGLLDRARRGDDAAFSALYERYQRAIFSYAAHMCGRQAGDDIVQETFLAVLKKGGSYDRSKGTVAAYLFGIARHFVFRQLASSREPLSEENGELEAIPGADATILDELTREELVAAVRVAVQELQPVFREAVVLCELQELDYATAAEIVGCPVGTIRSRLYRAKWLLTKKLAALRPGVGMRG